MKWIILPAAVILCPPINAQEVQWATRVIEYSSQLSDYEYAAAQVLGKPNVLPNAGDNPNAWLPDKPDRISFITVGYDQPVQIQQIAVAESYHPGSVYQIVVYDTENREHLINTFNPGPLNVSGRLLNVYIGQTDYPVNAVKVVIDGSKVPGYNAIDAIGISGNKVPIKAERDLALRRNPGLQGEEIGLGRSKGISDSHPVYVSSLKTLFFTRGFSPQNAGGDQDPGDVWFSTMASSGDSWETPAPLGLDINNIGYSHTAGFFNTGGSDVLLLGNISGKVNKETVNVVMVMKDGAEWHDISEQKIKSGHIASFDADYTLADEGKVMIISTERYDTQGGRDLYICFRRNDNKWTEPQNMGNTINTAHSEYSPFYVDSENTLYFSTPGYAGFGKGDIFRMVRQGDGWDIWSKPENIGTDVNSEWDERYFYFDKEDVHAYFARSDADSIYHIIRIEKPTYLEPAPLVVLRGRVSDSVDKKPLAAELTVNLMPENTSFGIAVSDKDRGSYEIMVPSGNTYRIVGKKDGYKPYEASVALENKNQAYGYDLDILMAGIGANIPAPEKDRQPALIVAADNTPEPVPSDEPDFAEIPADASTGSSAPGSSSAEHVLFGFNSDRPVPESMGILDQLAAFMLDHKDIRIEIAGFTDHIGNERFNVDLAIRRGISVKKYFMEKGIGARRIRVIGFGEKMPVIISTDIKDLQVNRRVEFNFTR